MNKYFKVALPVMALGLAVFAQEGSSGFDATTTLTSATQTITQIVTGIGALLAAAIGVYLAFVGYRKAREALNKA